MHVRTVLALTSALLVASPLVAQEPRSLAFSGGVSNFNKSEKRVEAGLELRLPTRLWKLAFATGLTVNDDKSAWIFAGLRRDFSLGGPWLVTPAFGVSLYEQGDGKDLGGPLEFRSALEIGYAWPSDRRLALVIYHLSNAGIYDRNPGMNSLVLTFSLPI
jgi:lipid A 3-O-deacylase